MHHLVTSSFLLLVTACTQAGTCPKPAPRTPAPPPACPPLSMAASIPSDPGFVPVVRKENLRFSAGRYTVELDPVDGGRIVEFSLNGHNVLVPKQESPSAYGSSFWPSPQSDWSWPPPPELDSLPWQIQLEGRTVVMTSGVNQKLGLMAEQRITAEPETDSLNIELIFTNRGALPRKVAPWQNTRVRPGGLVFYPSDAPTTSESSLLLMPERGITWFLHDPTKYQESRKSYADGREGWLAHLDRGYLFIKVFPDIPREAQAPKEGEIVLYVPDSGRFLEVEQQGAYVELAVGESTRYAVRWIVKKLPEGVESTPGNQALVELARRLIADLPKLTSAH